LNQAKSAKPEMHFLRSPNRFGAVASNMFSSISKGKLAKLSEGIKRD
jgi:hypothetical protein